MKKVGFVGVGVMGKSMVRNLMKKGFDVSIYTRTKSKVEDVISEGAKWCDTVKECAQGQDAVITIVGFPKDVEEVYFGENGIIENVPVGSYIIDMTTTSPKLDQRIYEAAKARGVHGLDAPVSGGDVGAQKGTLAIMVGGDKEDFEACLPIFQAMGTNIVYEGPSGAGQHCKMANQIALSGTLASCCEALTYAKAVGLDPRTMMDTISTGAAGSWQMSNNGYKMLVDDYKPGFFVAHYIKDMKLAVEELSDRGKSLPILNEVLSMFEELSADGGDRLGTQALIQVYDKK